MCFSEEENNERRIIRELDNEGLINHLKIGLKNASRGEGFIGYKYTRERVLGIPELENLVPWFLKHCENIESFYTFIKKRPWL